MQVLHVETRSQGAFSISEVVNNFWNVKGNRVLRGGSWFNYPQVSQVDSRLWSNPKGTYGYFGFRCAKSVTR